MQRPNILLLFPDQQRHDTIHANGADFMKTPNLDRLVEEGCIFRNAYSPNPVCMPARHYLLTGVSARHHGYYENSLAPIADEGIPTIPQVLSDHGYNTVAVGKMHFHPPRRHHGFDEMHLMEEIPHQVLDDAYLKFLKNKGLEDLRNIHGIRPGAYHSPQTAIMPEKDHGVNWVADKSIEWLEANGDSPFFMMCGWIKPHPPWNIPEEWSDFYKDASLPEPAAVSREFPFHSEECEFYGDNDSPETKRKIREAYYTSISMVDQAVGRVLNTLEEKGLMDNTIIIYSSDHGEMLQDKGLYSKEVPFDSAAKIPFIVRYPDAFKAGSINDNFTDLMDIFPLILELTGIDYNYKAHHRNYQLEGQSPLSAPARKEIYSEFGTGNRRWAMLRDHRYKYIYFYNDGKELFYDLKDDPEELVNLIGTDQLPEESFHSLKQQCIEIEKQRAPDGYVVNGDFIKYPPEEFHPFSDSKYPIWANKQFQTFGSKPNEQEAELFFNEVKTALGLSKEEFLESFPENDLWRQEFNNNLPE